MSEPSLWSFIADAGLLVKCVMLILFAMSVFSWMIIFQHSQFLKRTKKQVVGFEDRFWSGVNLGEFSNKLQAKDGSLAHLEKIFVAGFEEFTRLTKQATTSADAVMDGVQRAMRIASSRETDRLENHLSFLATAGSVSPYIGLFGTVWGIMTSFRALGSVQQASIAMVAPGISEALIATAMGLFAAIPAVIAYNRFTNDVERLVGQYDTFQEEFATILHRQLHSRLSS